MSKIKQKNKTRKDSKLHPRNKHNGRYDFEQLVLASPELKEHVIINKYKDQSINFFEPTAVKALNTALLKHHYKIDNWDIPDGYLCPPIPGRADYIHFVADLLKEGNQDKIPRGHKIRCLDIGVGANYVYPIIGMKEYGWSFVSTDIDDVALQSVENILTNNPLLKKFSEIRKQNNPQAIFKDIIKEGELFDLSICNPPFHASQELANEATKRKLKNLTKTSDGELIKNFGGQSNELWCEGGEGKFISNMILESRQFQTNCLWFTTLASKKETVENTHRWLEKAKTSIYKILPIKHGNKSTRIIAWSFMNPKQHKVWAQSRWQ